MLVRSASKRRSWFRVVERSKGAVTVLAFLNLAEQWAEEMEPLVAAGAKVSEVADDTFASLAPKLVPFERGSAMADLMVRYLSECWRYGSDLRKWYGPFGPQD